MLLSSQQASWVQKLDSMNPVNATSGSILDQISVFSILLTVLAPPAMLTHGSFDAILSSSKTPFHGLHGRDLEARDAGNQSFQSLEGRRATQRCPHLLEGSWDFF